MIKYLFLILSLFLFLSCESNNPNPFNFPEIYAREENGQPVLMESRMVVPVNISINAQNKISLSQNSQPLFDMNTQEEVINRVNKIWTQVRKDNYMGVVIIGFDIEVGSNQKSTIK